MIDYGEALKYQRESNKLSMGELAKQIDTSHQNIGRWERNEVLPNIDFCVQLADFYGISLDELVGREKIPNPKLEKEKYAKQITYQNSTHNGNNNF